METLLIAITLLAVAAAVVSSVIAWRLAREARTHAAARIAALSAAAGPAPLRVDEPIDAPVTRPPAIEAPLVVTAPRHVGEVDEFAEPRPPRHDAPAAVAWDDRFMGSTDTGASGPGPQRWLAAAAAVLLVVLLGVTFTRTAGRTSGRAGATAAAPSAAKSTAPLELVSMRHEWRDGQLSVEGEVRAPAGQTPAGLEAVALLFDRAGGLVTSAVAPVAVPVAGNQPAHFAVSLPAPPTAARYRVSFRAAGMLLPHVDLRAGGAAPAGQVSSNR